MTNLGLLTDDLRVIANTKEQRQKVRGHELLERKEELVKVSYVSSLSFSLSLSRILTSIFSLSLSYFLCPPPFLSLALSFSLYAY